MYMIIYKTVNLFNGKFYIGKDAINNPDYFGSGVILERSIKKYGKENFRKEIIETCSSLDELNDREVFWIKELNATNRKIGYNIALGGDGGDIYNQLSDIRKKQSVKKVQDKLKIIRLTDEYKKKRSDALRRSWTENRKKKMAITMSGREIPWSNKISQSIKEHWGTRNRTISDEQRKKRSLSAKGRILKQLTEEQERSIVELYQTIGPKLIEKQIGISRYIVVNVLKRKGLYQKWQKGIGEKSKKHASLLMKGNKQGKRTSLTLSKNSGE
jgi:group I intron endonuclease